MPRESLKQCVVISAEILPRLLHGWIAMCKKVFYPKTDRYHYRRIPVENIRTSVIYLKNREKWTILYIKWNSMSI